MSTLTHLATIVSALFIGLPYLEKLLHLTALHDFSSEASRHFAAYPYVAVAIVLALDIAIEYFRQPEKKYVQKSGRRQD
jgi:hypothetical protein